MKARPVPELLWLAPTRPALKAGVPYEGFYINLIVTFVGGMVAGAPYYWAVGVLIHYVVLRPLTSWDPNFFRVLRLWAVTKGEGAGSDRYGAPALMPLPEDRAASQEEYQVCV